MRLEPVDEDIWIAEGPLVDFYGFPYPTRAVIVRLPDKTLWVWSPIKLDVDLKQQDPSPLSHRMACGVS